MSAKKPTTVTTVGSATVFRPSQSASSPRQHFEDFQLKRLQDSSKAALQAALGNPIQNPNMILGVTFSAGVSQAIRHYLGRTFLSFIACGHRGGGYALPVIQSQLSALDASQVTLLSANSGTVDILIW